MVRGWLQRLVRAGRIIACAALLVACSQVIHNEPINQPLPAAPSKRAELGRDVDTYFDDTVIALSFSGGGTRAAAFSYGVLERLRRDAGAEPIAHRRLCSTASTSSPAYPAARSLPPITG